MRDSRPVGEREGAGIPAGPSPEGMVMSSLLAQPWYDGFHWWFPLIPLAWFVAFWLLVIFLVRRLWWRGAPRGQAPSAEAVLGQRFAEGQIDEQEYRARLQVLRSAAADRH
jgi:putative membrane protein